MVKPSVLESMSEHCFDDSVNDSWFMKLTHCFALSLFPYPPPVWQWSLRGTACLQWRSTALSLTSTETSLSSEPVSALPRSLKWEEASTCDRSLQVAVYLNKTDVIHSDFHCPLWAARRNCSNNGQCEADALWSFTVYGTVMDHIWKMIFKLLVQLSPRWIWTTFPNRYRLILKGNFINFSTWDQFTFTLWPVKTVVWCFCVRGLSLRG